MTHEQAAYRRYPLDAEAPTVTGQQADLRDRIAEALARFNGWHWAAANLADLATPGADRYRAMADAVLAVLPPAADRAAVLRDLIAKAEEWDGHITAQELRRMADEPQPAEARRPLTLSTPCANPDCKHPYNWHKAGVCQAERCDCIAFAVDAQAAEAQQQPAKTPVGYSGKGRVWCLSCPHPDDENVPVTVDLLQPYEECARCGRDVVDVALAAAHQAEQHENPEQRTTVEYRADCPICRRKQRSAAADTSEEPRRG